MHLKQDANPLLFLEQRADLTSPTFLKEHSGKDELERSKDRTWGHQPGQLVIQRVTWWVTLARERAVEVLECAWM